MKAVFPILILLLFGPVLTKSQCPVTSPTSNLNNLDGGSPGCDAGSYRYVASMASNAAGTCFEHSNPNSCGIGYYGSTYSITCGFCVTFDLTLAPGTNDGMAFTMADFSQTPSGNPCSSPIDPCAPGGNIGYHTFNNSASNLNGGGALTIEFDSFTNAADDDPACDHVSIVEDGDNGSSQAQGCSTPIDLNDGLTHAVEICWDPAINQLIVDIDGSNIITFNSDISTYFSGTDLHFAVSGGVGPAFTGTNSMCNWDVIPYGTPLAANDLVLSSNLSGKVVELNWTTSEGSNSVFTVEKLVENEFRPISGEIQNMGKDFGSFTDAFPGHGKNVYRIKQSDPLHEIRYSNKAEILIADPSAFQFSQTDSKFRVTHGDSKYFRVWLHDLQGRKMIQGEAQNSWSLDLRSIPKGIYIVRLYSRSETYARVIQNN